MKQKTYLFMLMLVFGLAACKKKAVSPDTTTTPAGSKLDLIRDSIYLYAKEDYLWYDALPTYEAFNPRSYTVSGADTLGALQKEVNAISQFKKNPVTGNPYEYDTSSPGSAKYSFIDQGQVSTILSGTQGDFGCDISYNAIADLRIEYVYPQSPAALAGIKRGYQITKINNSTSLSYDGNTPTKTNLNFIINAFYYSSTITMTLLRPNGTSFNVSLNTANYTTNPVLKDTILTGNDGQKIGYMVFNRFTELTNAKTYIDQAFTYFTNNGITDLVVDLRYNGGGAVETSEYLANLIVPAAKSGTTMYSAYFNDKLQANQYPLLGKVYAINPSEFSIAANTTKFAKSGTLSLSRVFFIVTGQTASASELTINNLIPQMTVKLIGETSYGKPVGFFAIPINKYELYVPEFETKNAVGAGGYYTGMTPGSTTYPGVADYDDLTKDFGDPTETLLAHAISYVKTGTFALPVQRVQSIGSGAGSLTATEITQMHGLLGKHNFKDMVVKFKKK